MKFNLYFILALITSTAGVASQSQIPLDYKGRPFGGKPQVIPGRVELVHYDRGGEGVAYHDSDAVNKGAEFNHRPDQIDKAKGVPDEVAYFRAGESVDISYTKHWVDFQESNLVMPGVNQNYIGWQEDGEWTNYTVDVKVKGRYKVIVLYGNKDNQSSLWLNGDLAAELVLPIDTGFWHNWNKAVAGEINFDSEGLNLLTLKYNSGASIAYLDFVPFD